MKANSNLKVLFVLLIGAFFAAACGPNPERQSRPSADWSRGVEVSRFGSGSISLVTDQSGERIHLVWASDMGEGTFIRYQQLDGRATPVLSKDLDFPDLLRAPRLVWAGADRLHLFWVSRPAGGKTWTTWHTLLDLDGNVVADVSRVSLSGVNVGNYVVASDHGGGAVLAWGSGSQGDVYLCRLGQDGSMSAGPKIITSAGDSPSIWVSANGNLYLAWLEASSFVFSRATLDGLELQEPTRVVDLRLGTGDSMYGPIIGVAGDYAYLFWSIIAQSGLEAGSGTSFYTAFPIEAPAISQATRIWMLPDEDQPYHAYQGNFRLTQLVPPVTDPSASSEYILHPSVMAGSQNDELAVAIALNQKMRLDEHLQIAVAIFADGQFNGYTLATKTDGISDEPVLYIDASQHLHLAWRLGAGGRKIYYATTNPGAIAALDRLSSGDLINAILEGSVEGLVGMALLPVVGFGWMLPGLLIIGIYKLVRDQETMQEWKSWIPLSISILLYQVVKLATLPTIAIYTPFSAWVDLPGWLGAPLRVAAPLIIFALAVYVADLVRKRQSQSSALFYVIFTLTDATLTLAIYGVTFLGVY
jgi:hypothetical protein